MRKIVLGFFIFIFSFVNAQTPTAGELVKMHSVTVNEMQGIIGPIEGTVVFNTSDTSLYQFNGSNWVKLIQEETKTIILNRSGGSLPTGSNTFYDLPVGSGNIQTNNTTYFSVIGDAEIRVLNAGNYLITGELSTRNMPAGDTKFILAIFINGARRGYLSRGSVSLPSTDFWGTTGAFMYNLNTNDVINIRYVINAGGATLNADFTNIGITKI